MVNLLMPAEAFTLDHVLKADYRFGSSLEFGLDLILDGLERALEAASEVP